MEIQSIQIKDLQQTPTLSDNTEIPLQRTGATKAEKTKLSSLTTYLLSNPVVTSYITNSINTLSSSGLSAHINGTDPHADRAYTDSSISSHRTATDPHGDRAYASNSISSSISAHNSAADPHGDRLYASSLVTAHSTSNDPHGDRTFTTNSINTSMTNHRTAIDPHGDRAYSDNSIAASVLAHKNAVDPHGDRSYTDSRITTSITSHVESEDPHGDREYVDDQLIDFNTTLRGYVDTSFSTKIGTTIAPLTSGKIPAQYIDKNLKLATRGTFPAIGDTANLYVDTTDNSLYFWDGITYQPLTPEISLGDVALTTDDVPEGSNPNRKYLTTDKVNLIDSKVSTILPATNSGHDLIHGRLDQDVVLKNIDTEGSISIESSGTVIKLLDKKYSYKVVSNSSEVELLYTGQLKENILEDYSGSFLYSITGEVFAYASQDSGSDTLVNEFNSWKIDSKLSTVGVTEAVPPASNVSITSTGNTLNGVALPSSTVEIYNADYSLLKTVSVNTLGNFSTTLTPAITDGSPLYLHVKTSANERSGKTTVFSPNLVALRPVTNLSISPDGLKIRGITERTVAVTVTNDLDEVLGTANTSSTGYFEITVATALVVDSVIKINSVNSYGTNGVEELYTVKYTETTAPYNVRINNVRSSIIGKAEPNTGVEIYNEDEILVASLTVNSIGDFSGTLAGLTFENSVFTLKTIGDTVDSEITELEIPALIEMQPEPNIVNVLVDSTFDFLYKDISKRLTNSLNFDIEINATDILLIGTNGLNKTISWSANLKITAETIG